MKKALQTLAILAAGAVAGVFLHESLSPRLFTFKPPEPQAPPVIDTIPYYDTIRYRVPVAKADVSLGTRITFVPVFSHGEMPADSGRDSVAVRMTAIHDSIAVEIPITQKEYEGAEYRAWVSGYEPTLDSIFVFPRHDVVTIREPPNKTKRWGIGVFAGYGVTPHGLQPCAGVSINYNLWNF